MRLPIKLEKRAKHGFSRAYTYRAWQTLRARQDGLYGPWDDYQVFLRDVGKRPPGANLVRLDASRPWEPGNVRWGRYNRKERRWE